MSDEDKDKILFSITPEVAAAVEGFGRMVLGMAELARVSGGIATLAASTSPRVRRYRIFSISAMAHRNIETGLPPRIERVEFAHYAHLKAVGSKEQARAAELEYALEKWPLVEGWEGHSIDLLEVTEDFASGEMRRIVVSDCLEARNDMQAQPPRGLVKLNKRLSENETLAAPDLPM